MNTKVYKILDTKTGLFSTGGGNPRFTSKGKTWSGRGPLMSHLGLLLDNNPRLKARSASWVIVEMELVETNRLTIENAIADLKVGRVKRAEAQKRANERYQREMKIRQFEQLKRELGK